MPNLLEKAWRDSKAHSNVGFFYFGLAYLVVVSLCLLISIQPGRFPFFGPTGHNLQRAIELALIFSSLLFLLAGNFRSRVISLLMRTPSTYIFSIIGLMLILMASSIYSDFPLRSFQESGLYTGLLLFAVGIACVFQVVPRDFARYFCLAFATVLSFNLLFMILVGFSFPATLSASPMVVGFSNIRSFNHVQAILIPVVYVIYYEASLRRVIRVQAFCFSILVCQWVLLFYTQGRGVFLALTIGFWLYFVCYQKNVFSWRRLIVVSPIGTVVFGFVVYWLLFIVWPEAEFQADSLIDRADSGRLYLWGVSVLSIMENPLFGVGGQGFVTILEEGREPHGSAHNFILNFGVEFGLVASGVVGFLWVRLAQAFYSDGRECNGLSRWIALPLLTSIIYSMVTGVFLSPLSQFFSAVLVGLYWSGSVAKIPSDGVVFSGAVVHRLAIAVFLTLASLMALTSLAVSAVDVFFSGDSITFCLRENLRCFPRFWLNGDFRQIY